MNILIIFINNINSIKNLGFDLRYETLRKIAFYLKDKHKIYVMPCDAGTKLTSDVVKNFEIFNFSKKNSINLCIGWIPVIHKQNLRKKINCEFICYENGPIKNSVIIDPNGVGYGDYEPFYTNTLNNLCVKDYDDNKCTQFLKSYIKNNNSKRPQSNIIDIPTNINNKYIFMPTQKHTDIFFTNAKIGVFDSITKTALYCKNKNIYLVIKIHPAIGDNLRREQINHINQIKRSYQNIFISQSSINYLMKNALFTVSLNGFTIIDNFINQTPLLTLLPNMYYKTDALVYNEDIFKGLDIMFHNKYDKEKMFIKQKQIIWWYMKNNLFYDYSVEKNIEILNKHLQHKILI